MCAYVILIESWWDSSLECLKSTDLYKHLLFYPNPTSPTIPIFNPEKTIHPIFSFAFTIITKKKIYLFSAWIRQDNCKRKLTSRDSLLWINHRISIIPWDFFLLCNLHYFLCAFIFLLLHLPSVSCRKRMNWIMHIHTHTHTRTFISSGKEMFAGVEK